MGMMTDPAPASAAPAPMTGMNAMPAKHRFPARKMPAAVAILIPARIGPTK